MLFWQILIDGFAISSLYALAATGFTLIFGVSGVLNLSHGALMVAAAVGAWALNSELGSGAYLGAFFGILTGVVLTMVQKIAIHTAFTGSMRDAYGDLILENAIPHNTAFKECAVARQPLAQWKPKGAPAKAVDAVAGEILTRVSRIRGIVTEAA